MAWLVCFICGIAGAGLVLTTCDWISDLFQMSKFEGTNGYLFVFVFTPMAFVGGIIVGALTIWRIGPSGYLRMQGIALLMTAAVFWVVVFVSYLFTDKPPPPAPPLSEAEQKQALVAQQAITARVDEEDEAKFQKLTADSSLQEYLDARFMPGYDPEKYKTRQAQVIAGAAQVKSRQGDAIDLLNKRQIGQLEDLWRYSLSATPELCAAYNRAFVKYTTSGVGDPPQWGNTLPNLSRQMPNLKWLAGEHCDLDQSVNAYVAVVQIIAKTFNQYMMEQEGIAPLLNTLAELQHKP